MNDLIIESLGLLFGAFVIMAAFGWLLAGRAVSEHSAFERPRTHVLDAAETFTSGVVVPFKTAAEPAPAPKPAPQNAPMPAYVPQPAPRYEMAASNVAIVRGDRSLQSRVSGPPSTLASMTPDSVAAAVQQAGNGLAPMRLDAPEGAADDLTLISGVDQARQHALNELGIFHFWQVAGWTPEHVAWLSSRVESDNSGGGRIARENWMSQALRLAQLS